jgi:hypothetical protein
MAQAVAHACDVHFDTDYSVRLVILFSHFRHMPRCTLNDAWYFIIIC